jgi:hypothetical protein
MENNSMVVLKIKVFLFLYCVLYDLDRGKTTLR